MKTTRQGIIAIILLCLFHTQSYAIQDLKISVENQDVLLSWPSTNGETYIVQYRPTLDASTPWETLTNFYPATAGIARTSFVHSNIVQTPDCYTSSEFSMMSQNAELVPLAMKADGSGDAVPINLYPDGFDFSSLIIFDPLTQQAYSGAEYSLESIDPNDPGTPAEGDSPSCIPDTGFYRVVKSGVDISGLTNGAVLSGIVEFPVEMSLVSTDQITGISFYGNEVPLAGATTKSETNPWAMVWDTTKLPNGVYSISAEVNFAGDESETNLPVTVAVTNVISFPNYFASVFGNWMWVYAETTIAEADVEIAMYADETNYVGTFAFPITDGIISFIWELNDPYGNTMTNDNFSAIFSVTPASESSSGFQAAALPPMPATNSFARERLWSGLGKFVVAYSAADSNPTKTYKIGLMVSGGTGGEYGGVTQTLGSYGLGQYQLSPGNAQGSAYLMNDIPTKTNLLNYMADLDYRNFYYFGHGSTKSIGGAKGTSTPTITDSELHKQLHNFLDSMKPANFHPYRFVFIDGCLTGKGKLCEEFGIPALTTTTNFFNTAGVRSRAFLGFKKSISFNDSQWTSRSLMLSGFFNDWQLGMPLWQCVSNAVEGVHTTFQKMDDSYIIHGASDIRISSP